VLLRLNVSRTGGCLAEREEATNLVTQLAESAVLGGVEVIDVGHGTISLHDISWRLGLRQGCTTGQEKFSYVPRAVEGLRRAGTATSPICRVQCDELCGGRLAGRW